MLPSLATLDELEVRIGRQDDAARAEAVLRDASNLARDEAKKNWVDDAGAISGVPDVVVTLVLTVARRALENPAGLTSETVGDYTWRREGIEPGVYLTEREIRILRRIAGKSGLWTQATTRIAEDECGTGFVEDQFGCELFPYYALECPDVQV